jgi:hypothetical protein
LFIEKDIFLAVIANISWLIMLVAKYSETDYRIKVIISFEVPPVLLK